MDLTFHGAQKFKKYHYPRQAEVSKALSDLAKLSVDEILQSLKTSPDGLLESHARVRLKKYGFNEVAHEKRKPWFRQLLSSFKTPFNLLLLTIAVISYLTGSIDSTVVITGMVLISAFLRFIQEYRSSKASEKLQALVSTTATVYRRERISGVASTEIEPEAEPGKALPEKSIKREIPIKNLVLGDVIQLSSGDMIPADLRLIAAKDLLISEAALTGESMPVEKYVEPQKGHDGFLESNICYMGTSVVSGAAKAVVLSTGANTYFGSLAGNIAGKQEATSFDKGINRLSWLLIRYILVTVSAILIINGLNKGSWLEAFLFALSVAVGLTPEMLPMIVTTNLAKGALLMSKKKVIVKKLNAIQNFGAMDILCTDKTGTLTQNRIILDKHMDIQGHESMKVLKYAYLNSFYQTGLKNLLDEAVLKHAEAEEALKLEGEFGKIDEIPFDFVRRRMTVVVEKNHQQHFLICKGAVEEIFRVCTHVENNEVVMPIDDAIQQTLNQVTRDLNEDGFRVVAIAYKALPPEQTEYSAKDESGLILLGYISFLDPPKETARLAIAALNQYGVQVKILTGDNDIITRKVCKDVGLPVEQILLGRDIDKMPDQELEEAVEATNVFAKLTPKHKEQIIKLLRKKGHVVGFLGDGINDASALKAADVGVSVDDATDIAKESADIILLEKSLLVLKEGVLEGRTVFGNIMKYIRMTTSSNFGNVFSMVGASLLLPFLPMLPIHILIQNMLYDFSQIAIPLDKVDEEYLVKPRKWEIANISRFMMFFGPVSSIFDYATFGVLWFILGANGIEKQSLFQSGWFIEGLLSQTLIVHMIRTRKIPFIESSAALPLILLTVLVMAVGIYLPFSPLAPWVGLRALPSVYFIWLAAILLSYCVLIQIVKTWFSRKFGYNE